MKTILMQQSLWEILSEGNSDEKKAEMDEKEKAKLQNMQYIAYSTLILNLTDRVLSCRKGQDEDFGILVDGVKINCDSNSAICLAKMFHKRSKHIDMQRHFIRDEIQGGRIKVVKVPTEDNASDMLTKPLPVSKFRHCLDLVEVVEC